ncbi:MAG: hypothetical protein LCI00_24720 [Chloroflexi bacterium]|nr:hypothetical protein [Chloroflexota bacterium]MCC6895810.1 hypothetical protein [Anaerolineae bacterium]
MSQTVTLQLPDEVMEQVVKAATSSGHSVQDTLQTWISSKAKTVDTQIMLQQAAELPIYTPQGGEQTAQQLLAYGQQLQKEKLRKRDDS